MIPRRLLIAGAAAMPFGAAQASLPVPAARRLGFRVLRNDSPIGQHVLSFEPQGARLVVRIVVDLAVGIGPVTLYRYRHRATETWEGDKVVAFQAETNDDGSTSTIAMRAQGEALFVESSRAGRFLAPPGALPATHWNKRMLDGPFINTQTGEVLRPTVTRMGAEPLPWAPQRRGDRYVLSGAIDLETWYDSTPGWAGLRFRGRDGSVIHYAVS